MKLVGCFVITNIFNSYTNDFYGVLLFQVLHLVYLYFYVVFSP